MRGGGGGGPGVRGGGVKTPWGPMLRTAALLGMAPPAFWRLSLKEWRMLTETERGPEAMGRGRLDELMGRWPDGEPAGD